MGNPFAKALTLKFILPFFLITGLVALVKGRAAVRWSMGMLKSGGVNFGLFASNTMFGVFVFLGGDWLTQSWKSLGAPQLDSAVWATMPFWLVVLIATLSRDFVDYWNHRLLHGNLLWPVHAVHHSDPDLNFTTTFRVHFLEPLVMKVSYLLLISWMALPSAAAAAPIAILLIFNMYLHADLDWDHGPLRKVIASPRYHQWHHAEDPNAYNKNFANVFSFWDVLFGTFYCPGKCNVPYGFEGSPNHDFVSLWVLPFKMWGEAIVARFKRKSDVAENTAIAREQAA